MKFIVRMRMMNLEKLLTLKIKRFLKYNINLLKNYKLVENQ